MATQLTKNLLTSILCIFIAVACAESPEEQSRGTLGLGTPTDSEALQVLAGGSGPTCTAVPEFASVASGERFNVTVSIAGAEGPVIVQGFELAAGSTSATISGAIGNSSSQDVSVVRSVRIVADNGSGRCAFRITVRSNN